MNIFDNENITKRLDQSLTVWSIVLWCIVIYYASTQMMARARYGVLFLGVIVGVYVLDEVGDALEEREPIDVALLALSSAIVLVATIYLYLNFEVLNESRVGYAFQHEYLLAGALVLAIVYLTFRSFGRTFLFILAGGILYGLFGNYVPGTLGHGGMSLNRILLILVLELEGFYGFLNRLVAAWIALFLLYAGLLQGYGAFDLIFRAASKSSKYVSSGVAQTAVLASAVIGSINGSQTANAGMTGSFTIPLMKENGIEGRTAGGIEAVASTSGQVLPPVMGAGAFVMASLVRDVSYIDIIVAGLIPAVILVVCIVVAVHYVSLPQLDPSTTEEMHQESKPRREVVAETIKFGIPFVVLIYTLGIAQWTVMTSALYTVIAMLTTGISMPIAEQAIASEGSAIDQLIESLRETVEGARVGALATAPVAIILASINGIVDMLMTSGVPGKLSLTLMSLSGGVLLVAALLAMGICIIMGLGMPTTAAYTVVALLVAPTLINSFLIPELAAHFFVFYAAILAGLTPPIATCAAVAAGVANADFWKTCVESIKISFPLFVLPFAFLYHPRIVSGEFTPAILTTGAIALLGALAIIHGINFPFDLNRWLTLLVRATFVGLGTVAMVHPSQMIQIGALGVIVIMVVIQQFTDVGELAVSAQPEH